MEKRRVGRGRTGGNEGPATSEAELRMGEDMKG